MGNLTRRNAFANEFATLLAPVTVAEVLSSQLDAGSKLNDETILVFFGDLTAAPATVQIYESDVASGGALHLLETFNSSGMEVVQRKINRTRRWLQYVVTPEVDETFNVAIYLMR